MNIQFSIKFVSLDFFLSFLGDAKKEKTSNEIEFEIEVEAEIVCESISIE